MTVTLPETLQYGKVVGRFVLAVGDEPTDADYLPNAVPAVGTISFTSALPLTKEMLATPPTTVVRSVIQAAIDNNGFLYNPKDPTGPRGIWLVAGVYKVAYNLNTGAIKGHDILVLPEHTAESPMDLINYMPPGGPVLTASQYAELAARIVALEAGGGGPGGGGVTDHGALTGLGDDDHTQYHTNARGDARYYTKGQTDALLSGATPSSASGALPRGMAAVVMGLANVDVEPFKMLFVGDSLTHDGIQDATLAIWPGHLIKRLTHTYQPGTTPVPLVENGAAMTTAPTSGIVGWNISKPAVSSGAYVQAADVTIAQTMQPRVIFHCIGANDRMGSQSPVNAANNIRAAISALDAVIVPKPVHVLHWFGSLYHNKPWPVDTLVGYYIDIAAENPSHRVALDLGPYADSLGINDNISGTGDPYGLDSDALHLTAKGYRMWGELVFRALTAAPAANVLGWSAPQPTAPGTTTTTTTAAGTTTTTTTTAGTTTTTTTTAGTTTTTTTAGGRATITDSFDRANSAVGLGTTDTGETWVQIGTGVMGVSNNAAYPTAHSAATAIAIVNFGEYNMEASFVAEVSGTTGPEIFVFANSAGVIATPAFRIVRQSATAVKFGNGVGGTTPVNPGDKVTIRAKKNGSNTDLWLLVNDVVKMSQTIAVLPAPTDTYAGLYFGPYGGTNRVASFEVKVPA